MKKKIWEHADINECIASFNKKSIVLVGGCFDLLHYGHHTFLQHAKAQGDILIVALESDKHIKNKKKYQPVHTQQERAEILAALSYIDAIILLSYIPNDSEYQKLVEHIHPSIIAISEGDPHKDKKQMQAARIGAKLKEVVRLIPRFSTRAIIESL